MIKKSFSGGYCINFNLPTILHNPIPVDQKFNIKTNNEDDIVIQNLLNNIKNINKINLYNDVIKITFILKNQENLQLSINNKQKTITITNINSITSSIQSIDILPEYLIKINENLLNILNYINKKCKSYNHIDHINKFLNQKVKDITNITNFRINLNIKNNNDKTISETLSDIISIENINCSSTQITITLNLKNQKRIDIIYTDKNNIIIKSSSIESTKQLINILPDQILDLIKDMAILCSVDLDIVKFLEISNIVVTNAKQNITNKQYNIVITKKTISPLLIKARLNNLNKNVIKNDTEIKDINNQTITFIVVSIISCVFCFFL